MYCVLTKCYDDLTSEIVIVQESKLPKKYKSGDYFAEQECDVYVDRFNTAEKAKRFVEEELN